MAVTANLRRPQEEKDREEGKKVLESLQEAHGDSPMEFVGADGEVIPVNLSLFKT